MLIFSKSLSTSFSHVSFWPPLGLEHIFLLLLRLFLLVFLLLVEEDVRTIVVFFSWLFCSILWSWLFRIAFHLIFSLAILCPGFFSGCFAGRHLLYFLAVLSWSTAHYCTGICLLDDCWIISSLRIGILFYFQRCISVDYMLRDLIFFFSWCHFPSLVGFLDICIFSSCYHLLLSQYTLQFWTHLLEGFFHQGWVVLLFLVYLFFLHHHYICPT